MYLGVSAEVTGWSEDGKQFSLVIGAGENPLTDFVEISHLSKYKDLVYSNVLCGAIRGALEMVQMKVECYFVKDALKGDDTNEIRVVLKEILRDTVQDDD